MPPGLPISALEQIMRQRAKADPTAPPITVPEESGADQLYRMLLEQQSPAMREPSTMERVAAGLMIPNTPIVHGRSAPGRMLLRGLVGGFKGSQGFGVPGQGALSRAALTGQLRGGGAGGITPAQLLNLQFRERADQRQETLMRSLLGQRQFAQDEAGRDNARMLENMQTDNARMAEQFKFQQGNEAFNRMDANRRYALDAQRESRLQRSAEAALAKAGAAYNRWPELWKREYQSDLLAIRERDQAMAAAAAANGQSYDASWVDQATARVAQKFADREMQQAGKPPAQYFEDASLRGMIQTGGSSSAGPKPAAPAKGAPKQPSSGGVPKRGSW